METKNINIAEILKDAPKGLQVKLYSPLIGECWCKGIYEDRIKVVDNSGANFMFDRYGKYFNDRGECIIFPTPGQTWEHWQEFLFEQGCFVKNTETKETFLIKDWGCLQNEKGEVIENVCMDDYGFANGTDISSFLNRVIDNGFRYNVSENIIEPYIIPENKTIRFSVGKTAVDEVRLTQKQYDVVKAVIEMITKKK